MHYSWWILYYTNYFTYYLVGIYNICKTKPIKLLLDWITFCIKNIPWWNKNLLISEQRVFLSLSLSSDNYLTKDQSSSFPFLIFFTHPPLKMTWKCILYYQLNDCKSSWTNSVWSISASWPNHAMAKQALLLLMLPSSNRGDDQTNREPVFKVSNWGE